MAPVVGEPVSDKTATRHRAPSAATGAQRLGSDETESPSTGIAY